MTRKYVARQPIVERTGKPYAYELLYRNLSAVESPDGSVTETTTKDLISALEVDFKTEELTLGTQAFINLPRESIMSNAILYLEPGKYVIEILSDGNIDYKVVERIEMLRKKHFQFSVQDFGNKLNFDRIVPQVSYINVDFHETPIEKQKEIIYEYKKRKRKRLLAENIQTEEDFAEAKKLGYDFFKGHYFAQPTLLIRESVGFSQTAVVMLLNELHHEDADFNKIDRIINTDAGLTFRLLSRGNTMQFAGKSKFTNPAQVVVRMGMEELQKWATLLLMQESAEPGQEEKMELALMRAIFLESLALKMEPNLSRQDRYYIYLKGMFSIFPSNKREEVFDAMEYEPDLDLVDLANDLITFNYAYEVGDYEIVDIFLQAKEITDGTVLGCYKVAITAANEALFGNFTG